VNDQTLSLDVIHEAVNSDGHYLGQPQTLEIMQTEYHYPHTADRATRKDWEMSGELDMRERAKLKAKEILKTSYPKIISEEVDQQLRSKFNILLPREALMNNSLQET
jgi:trimethylamine--corrinoid protein Co-methyltransferase